MSFDPQLICSSSKFDLIKCDESFSLRIKQNSKSNDSSIGFEGFASVVVEKKVIVVLCIVKAKLRAEFLPIKRKRL